MEAAPPTTLCGEADFGADSRLRRLFPGARILLVEDEPISREIAQQLLENVGLRIDLAEDGRQAHALTLCNAYALILMDMQLPVMNGVEAARAIRDQGAASLNAVTPIVAMTANAFGEDRQACLDAGMVDHITKPVDPDHLYETVLKWLEKPAQFETGDSSCPSP